MGSEAYNSGVLGTGCCLPEKVLTNCDLEKMVDTTDEWILKRTGIKERRILEDSEPASSLGIEAAKRALSDANLEPPDIDMIIVSTNSPDYFSPSMACIIQGEIGAVNASAFDVNAACSGFVYALTIADQFIKTDSCKNILIVSVEQLSRITDWKHRNTCVLFGDGAGAAVIGRVKEGYGLLSSWIGADGASRKVISIPACYMSEEDKTQRQNGVDQVIWMDGSEVFKFAIRIMSEASKYVIEKAGLTIDDVALVIPHQANIRIIEGAAKRLEIEPDKVYSDNVSKYGNTSSSSVIVALDEASKKGKIKKGDNIVLVGFGGGLTWASSLIKWSKGV
ncbi:MAG: ketoacyl-ACP synthase III [Eubacteriales bacterium]|nr:ketoacyl-ACP synthase III [Eubacteriales bacterium]